MSENYEPPQSPPPPPRSPFAADGPGGAFPSEEAGRKLQAPAIILMVLTILSLLMTVASFSASGSEAFMDGFLEAMEPRLREAMEESGQSWDDFAEQMKASSAGGSFFTALQVLLQLVILAGSWMMYKRQNYPLSMAAAIIGCIPCFSPCCCLGMIPGIWALVLLVKPEVKACFA